MAASAPVVTSTGDGVPVTRASWRAMGSHAEVVVVGGAAELVELAIARIAELEQRWSRFRSDSEVSRLNQHAGSVVQVSTDTVALVTHLVQAWRATHGAFDPSLLPDLVALGYAASRDDPQLVSPALPRAALLRARRAADIGSVVGPDLEGIGVDPDARLVRLPTGVSLDPGGLGKGLAADLVTAELLTAGADGAMVSLGGDLRVRGAAPARPGWVVGIRDPFTHDREIAQVHLLDGGVATSSTRRRVWRDRGRWVHHLLHPRTGRPLSGEIASATVVAGSAAWAEAWTKAVMVRGLDWAFADHSELDAQGMAAFAVSADGACRATRSWWSFAVGAADDEGRR